MNKPQLLGSAVCMGLSVGFWTFIHLYSKGGYKGDEVPLLAGAAAAGMFLLIMGLLRRRGPAAQSFAARLCEAILFSQVTMMMAFAVMLKLDWPSYGFLVTAISGLLGLAVGIVKNVAFPQAKSEV